jgi:hypothetical protein
VVDAEEGEGQSTRKKKSSSRRRYISNEIVSEVQDIFGEVLPPSDEEDEELLASQQRYTIKLEVRFLPYFIFIYL